MFYYFDYLFCLRSNNNDFYFDSNNEIIFMQIKFGKRIMLIGSELGYIFIDVLINGVFLLDR